jgi:hypothetical protein
LLAVPVALAAYFAGMFEGVLIRSNPMLVNERGIVQDAACTYSSGFETATVLIIGQAGGASCPWLYRYGSAAICDRSDLKSGVCQLAVDR